MSRRVNVSASAQKAIQQLSAQLREQVLKVIYAYALAGQGDVRHLPGKPNRWRLRAGNHRAIIEVTLESINVLRFAHRRESYREKKTLS